MFHMEQGGVQFAANAVGFFRCGGGGAHGDVVSVSELYGYTGKLGAVLSQDFLEVGKGLNFVKEGGSNLGSSRSWTLIALRLVPRETVVNKGLVNDIIIVAAVGRGVDGGVVVC